MIYTVGIDPGLDGAVAVLSSGEFILVEDMPVMNKGSGTIKREVDPAGLIRIIKSSIPPDCRGHIVIERVNAMPGQGVSSVFSLGDSFGAARASGAALGMPLVYVAPTVWKRYYKLERDKEKARALAIKKYPQAELHYKKHADRAEALLMANWLYHTEYGDG